MTQCCVKVEVFWFFASLKSRVWCFLIVCQSISINSKIRRVSQKRKWGRTSATVLAEFRNKQNMADALARRQPQGSSVDGFILFCLLILTDGLGLQSRIRFVSNLKFLTKPKLDFEKCRILNDWVGLVYLTNDLNVRRVTFKYIFKQGNNSLT